MKGKNLSLQYVGLIFLLINLFILILPGYPSHRNIVYSSVNSTEDPNMEDPNMRNLLWEIGRKNLSSLEFDQHPGSEAKDYIIPDADTNFPRGLSGEYDFLPSEIRLIFSINRNYSKNLFSMRLFGEGNLSVYFNAIPITETEIYTGMGWEAVDIPLPYILSGKQVITLEAKDTEGFLFFDYLNLTGFPDTDRDGICDRDEGEEDSDDDGLEDYLDEDCALIRNTEREKILLIVRQMDDSEISPIPVLRGIFFSDTPSIQGPVDEPADVKFLYGFVSGRIDNLEKSQEVDLHFSPPQSINLYGVEQIWIYNHQDGSWVITDYTLDKEARRFHIILKDGSLEDIDGETDAHIAFNLGLGIPTGLTPYSMGSCFLGLME